MSTFQSLIEKLSEFHRRYAKIKSELAAIDRLFDGDDLPAPNPSRPRDEVPAADEGIKQVVRFLRDAGGSLTAAEVAVGLNLPHKVTERHLTTALKLGFVQRIGYGGYQVVAAVAEV